MKICMDLGGDIKKRAAKKKILCPPPVAYIMNAALVQLNCTLLINAINVPVLN